MLTKARLNISWPVHSPADEVPLTNAAKLAKLKDLADVFESTLKTTVQNIPSDTEIIEIKLADWPCLPWSNSNGAVTLIGDAAHAMTMCKSYPLPPPNITIKLTDEVIEKIEVKQPTTAFSMHRIFTRG